MSDSSTDFDRSQLENRDREQLVVIATTLGRKPPSRAKKADIVDLILELAGVKEPEAAPKAETDSATATPVAKASEPTRRGGGRGAAAKESGGPDTGTSSQDAPSGGSSSPEANGSGGSPRKAAAQSTSHDGATDAEGTDNADSDTSSGDGDAGGPGQDGNGGQAGGDSSGRRRRRRGRDRGPGQGQGQGQNQGAEGAFEGEPVEVEGILDLRDDGYGFLRLHGYLPHRDDSYVSVKQVRQFGLRKGDLLKGQSRPPTRSEKNPALLRIDEVNGVEPTLARDRPNFDELTPLYPDEQLKLEHPDTIVDMTPRIIDLLAPIGKGQRGLIVSPPKSGKTTIMKTIARAIEQNNPEVHLMVLLVDERPEEVTDFKRWVRDGEVAASTFDRPTEEHTIIAELVIERAKRIVESGGDVVILVDGITRLARAYNLTVPASGRVMSGGIDAAALYPPKKFFGAARNVEDGGSLTILATALVDTNSRMDDHIFEEFKGTGNAELRLDRRLAERRIYPAIDVEGSSTRHEELLFSKSQLAQVWKLRRVLSGVSAGEGGSNAAALELLIDRMKAFKSNEAFLAELAKTAN